VNDLILSDYFRRYMAHPQGRCPRGDGGSFIQNGGKLPQMAQADSSPDSSKDSMIFLEDAIAAAAPTTKTPNLEAAS
jgi:hypothetical protein